MTPDGWKRRSLRDCLEDEAPGFWGEAPTGINEIAVLRSTNLRESGRLDLSSIAIRTFPAKKIEQKRLRSGDLLLERSGGGPKQPVGRVARFEHAGMFSFSNFMQRLRPHTSQCDGVFLLYELLQFHACGGTERLQQATTGISALRRNRGHVISRG